MCNEIRLDSTLLSSQSAPTGTEITKCSKKHAPPGNQTARIGTLHDTPTPAALIRSLLCCSHCTHFYMFHNKIVFGTEAACFRPQGGALQELTDIFRIAFVARRRAVNLVVRT